jgi:hypothetical protein
MSNTNYIDINTASVPSSGAIKSQYNVKQEDSQEYETVSKTKIKETDNEQPVVEQTHNLNEWNLDEIKPFFSMICFGCRRSGKSHLINYIISQISKKQKFTKIRLISATAKVQHDLWQFVKDDNDKIDVLDNSQINDIYNECIEQNEDYLENEHKYEYPPHNLIIFDDMISDSNNKSIFYMNAVNRLYFAGRHARLSCVLLLQSFKTVSPIVRSNTDYLIYFRTLKRDDRKSIASEYLTFDDSKECLDNGLQLMADTTSVPYQAFVIDKSNAQYATDFDSYCFTIKAPEKLKGLDKVPIYSNDMKVRVGENKIQTIYDRVFKRDRKKKSRMSMAFTNKNTL